MSILWSSVRCKLHFCNQVGKTISPTSAELAALLAEPALAAPKGVTANFEVPLNRNGLAWFVTTFYMVIATLSLLVRAYAKLWVSRKIQVEEVLMLCAYVSHPRLSTIRKVER